MNYNTVVEAKFISRPNRFIANVEIDGTKQTVHVKNTGRCRELLLPGSTVYLEKAQNPERKTAYDLIAVEHNGGVINIDSQAPNKVVKEWLERRGEYDLIKPEHKYGNSRIDFYMEKGNDKYLMEVKGCTLFRDGRGLFPDAPTERGARHLRELTEALEQGYKTIIAFVIQGEGISVVEPNYETDPEFAEAFNEAVNAGVQVLFLKCKVTPDTINAV